MTQLELADRMGISFQAVSNWERGSSMPDISKLPELAGLLNVSLDELLAEETELVEKVLNNDLDEIITSHNYSEEDLRLILALLKPEQVSDTMRNMKALDFQTINCFLPFLSEKDVKKFALQALQEGRSINAFLPFMSENDVKEFALRLLKT